MSDIPKITFTDEPIPSGKMAVLDANTKSLDAFMNSDESSTQDRNGDDYPTRKQLIKNVNEAIKNIGYVISGGTFESGATLTQQNAALLYQSDNQYYQWTGTLPKTVPANSTPQSTGGIANGAWILAGDSTLRKELSGANGAKMIGNGNVLLSESLSNLPTFSNIYDVFIIYGQSNSVGFAQSTSTPEQLTALTGKSYYWYYNKADGVYNLAKQNNFMYHSSGERSTGSAWNAFAREYITKTGRGVIFIPCAKGATSISELSKSGEWYSLMSESIGLYLSNIESYSLSIGDTYCLFNQGETDMTNNTSKDDYKNLLNVLVSDMVSDFNIKTFYLFLVGSPQSRKPSSIQQIQMAQIEVSESNQLVKLATDVAASFTESNGCLLSDKTHFTAKGYNLMGQTGGESVANDVLNLSAKTNYNITQFGGLILPRNNVWHSFNATLKIINGEWKFIDRTSQSTTLYFASNVIGIDTTATNGTLRLKLNFTPSQRLALSVTPNIYGANYGISFGAEYSSDYISISASANMSGLISLNDKSVTMVDTALSSLFSLEYNNDGYYILKHPRTFSSVVFMPEGVNTTGMIRQYRQSGSQTNFKISDYSGNNIRFCLNSGSIDLTKYVNNETLMINVSGIAAS